MATTLTMVVTDGRHVALGHVGDSRGYLLRDGVLRQITARPHLRPAPRRHRPAHARRPGPRTRGATSCCARSTATPRAAASTWSASTSTIGDRLLLCSDGLTDLVDDARIAEVLATEEPRRGGRDPHPARARRRRPRQHHLLVARPGRRAARGRRRHGCSAPSHDPWNVVDAAAVRLAEPCRTCRTERWRLCHTRAA